MNIKYQRKGRAYDESVAAYVRDTIESKCGGNELSECGDRSTATARALGRLVDILADRKILTVADVLEILERPQDSWEARERDHVFNPQPEAANESAR